MAFFPATHGFYLFFVHTFRDQYEYQELLIYEHSVNKKTILAPATDPQINQSDWSCRGCWGLRLHLSGHQGQAEAPEDHWVEPAAAKISRLVVEVGEIKVEIYRNDGIDEPSHGKHNLDEYLLICHPSRAKNGTNTDNLLAPLRLVTPSCHILVLTLDPG
ncbi:hypothetical protein PG985_007907 [Apiospora marii]|uniref:uncharacterized protein n=1 Tax=Apiospora marii TaxID=335849 RepID=UPI00313114E3